MNKHRLLTLLLSACLFLFLTILIYTLYCYVFFNKNQIKNYTDNYNNKEYTFIFNNLYNKEKVTDKDFYLAIYQTLDKETILKIYNEYYIDLYSEEDFLKLYYYGDIEVNNKDIEFNKIGKTTYGARQQLEYKTIKLNKENQYTKIGVLNNINLITEDTISIKFDNKELYNECNKECKIDNIVGGNHLLYLKTNTKEYVTFINMYDSNIDIDLSNKENFIILNETEEEQEEKKEIKEIKPGVYNISECYIKPNVYCATKKKSYIYIRDNKTVYFYLYNGWEIALTEYWGTYTIKNNFVIMNFTKHSYTAFDYDTRTYSTVESNSDSEQTYKIEGKYLIGDKYKIYYVGPIEEEEEE